jgi:glycerol-3-phosphate dehydrogenase (NAD(P)+)
MARISVIGGGSFGTAMACVLRRSRHEVRLWAREPEVVASINEARVNSLFLAGVKLDPGIEATGELAAAVRGSDFILMAVPAQYVRSVALALRPALPSGTPVVSCAKGIERGSCALMPEVLAEALPQAPVAMLSGPSFAREIAADLPCGVALACADLALARQLARDIANPRFCVHPGDDVAGTAIGGAMKNVVAIACGVAAGRRLGENARATLLALGLAETARLGRAKGARSETLMGLAGAGDMMLTAASLQSRNTSLGVALGEGRRAGEVLAERREVTEGVYSAAAVVALAQHLGVDMPIAAAVDDVVNRGGDLDAAVARITARAALG